MRFWDDMQTKYGFNDGAATPDGAEIFRAVYIRAVNKLAEQLGSKVRATAFDRTGVHNWCLILFYDVKDLADHTPEQLTEPRDEWTGEVLDPDEAMGEAIRQAYLLDLDSFIEVTVNTADSFEDFITVLYPVNEGDPITVEVNGQPQHIYPGGQVRLISEVKTFDGKMLPVGSEYAVTWINHHPPLVGLAAHPDDPVLTMTRPDALVVIEIPAEICVESENCHPIPPFHLRDLDDKTLDQYGVFYDWNTAQTVMQRAVRELNKSIKIVNGYSNTVMSCTPNDESE